MIDRRFRLARHWSNTELRRIAHLFSGYIVNVSAADDTDKEHGRYESYFINRQSYLVTNYGSNTFRGYKDREGEIFLDLTGKLPPELIQRFDVVFNHTTLEHIFDVQIAFSNLCDLSRDILIIVVPFAQVQHDHEDFKDYWRFTPACLRTMFEQRGFTVVYESATPFKNCAVYLFFVGARDAAKWSAQLPTYEPLSQSGSWIGEVESAPQALNGRGKMERLKDYGLDEYLEHQIAKKIAQDKLRYAKDRFQVDYEAFRKRFYRYRWFINGNIICLGARLGAEVKSLRDLGYSHAFGIDIADYDEEERYVIHGDFMKMQFADNTFDFSYTNSLDHAYDPILFFNEVARVMKPGGYSLFDIQGNPKTNEFPGFHIWRPESFDEIRNMLVGQGHTLLMREVTREPWLGCSFLIKWNLAPTNAERLRVMGVRLGFASLYLK